MGLTGRLGQTLPADGRQSPALWLLEENKNDLEFLIHIICTKAI